MAYKAIDKNRYVKNYSYVRAPKVIGIESPDLTLSPSKIATLTLPFVDNGLWIGGVNNGLPNGYYIFGTKTEVPDGDWKNDINQGIPNGYYEEGTLQNHLSTLGLKLSNNFNEEVSHINKHDSMLLTSTQYIASKLGLSSNLSDI